MPELNRLPKRIRLLSQRISVREVEGLHLPCTTESVEGVDTHHAHPAYGVYDERDQTISLDAHLPFERQRETFMHEVLHAILSTSQLDSLLNGENEGLDEHVVAVVAPIMLAFLRENPRSVAYLCEVQS